MDSLRKAIKKWKRKRKMEKYTRIEEPSYNVYDAINDRKFELAKTLIDGGNGKKMVIMQDDSGATPLIKVCQSQSNNQEESFDFVCYLLDKGARISIKDNSGKTAMDCADDNNLETTKHVAYDKLEKIRFDN